MLKIPPLFKTKKEFLVVIFILITIILTRLFFIYQDYSKLKNLDHYYYTDAQVETVFKDQNRTTLLKLNSKDGYKFYLRTKNNDINNLDWLKVKIKPQKSITFIKYLRGFIAQGDVIQKSADGFDVKRSLRESIADQHISKTLKSFYSTIFLADQLDNRLREAITALGSSHLVALSGFHLGIIWVIIFSILFLPYKIIKSRFFPWRNTKIDLGFISLVILALFVLFVGYPPTLIRAYFMILIGWMLLVFGVELVSFELLLFALLLIVAIAPTLILSVGFWLSIIGVFYIFLILKWLQDYPAWLLTFIIIPLGIFIFMFPIAHYFFGATSIWQLLSPLLSVVFILFYPISALLHAINLGWLFDKEILWLLNLPKEFTEVEVPSGLIALYIISSLYAVFSKKAFYFTLIFSIIITTWVIYLSL